MTGDASSQAMKAPLCRGANRDPTTLHTNTQGPQMKLLSSSLLAALALSFTALAAQAQDA